MGPSNSRYLSKTAIFHFQSQQKDWAFGMSKSDEKLGFRCFFVMFPKHAKKKSLHPQNTTKLQFLRHIPKASKCVFICLICCYQLHSLKPTCSPLKIDRTRSDDSLPFKAKGLLLLSGAKLLLVLGRVFQMYAPEN